MFRWSGTFFILAFISAVIGFGFVDFNGVIIHIGRVMFFIFVSSFFVTLLIGLKMTGKHQNRTFK